MSSHAKSHLVDPEHVRRLFDLRGSHAGALTGRFEGDPYPRWHELRAQAPVHEGVLHELTGCEGPAMYHGLPYEDRPHFSAFSFAAVDFAYRNPDVFASSAEAVDLKEGELGPTNSMLSMGGHEHRRHRALVQPSFVPAKAQWWIENWIEQTVHGLIDSIVDDDHAELNVDFCAAIPVLTITGSFGVPVDKALYIRESFSEPIKIVELLAPIVEARREEPQDDLISVLVGAELTEEDGTTHRLSDPEIYSFAILLLQAGSGTTWKQLGILLTALLERPEVLDAVRADRALLKPAIEEGARWMPNLPMFSRWVTEDIELFGKEVPKGSVVHLGIAPANRDPERWERPDDFDIFRPYKSSHAFGGGPHICVGMHVARAEMSVAVNALLDRLPNLRLDPDRPAPRIIGMYERGATEIPVLFG